MPGQPRAHGAPATFVALLRAVNVSGQNRVPMAALRDAMTGLGFERVETYLQSGNVVFDAAESADLHVIVARAAAIHDLIAREFGGDVRVLVLPAAELARVAAADPFAAEVGEGPAGLARPADPKTLHVTFLERPVPEVAFRALSLPAAPGEGAVLGAAGRVIYLHLPHGYGRTKLNNAYFERALKVPATTRNRRSVQALVEMSARTT